MGSCFSKLDKTQTPAVTIKGNNNTVTVTSIAAAVGPITVIGKYNTVTITVTVSGVTIAEQNANIVAAALPVAAAAVLPAAAAPPVVADQIANNEVPVPVVVQIADNRVPAANAKDNGPAAALPADAAQNASNDTAPKVGGPVDDHVVALVKVIIVNVGETTSTAPALTALTAPVETVVDKSVQRSEDTTPSDEPKNKHRRLDKN